VKLCLGIIRNGIINIEGVRKKFSLFYFFCFGIAKLRYHISRRWVKGMKGEGKGREGKVRGEGKG